MERELNRIDLCNNKFNILLENLNKIWIKHYVFYMNIKDFHWNIKVDHVYEFYLKFEKMYKNSLNGLNEIMKRMLTLHFSSLHIYLSYFSIFTIEMTKDISNGTKDIKNLKGYGLISLFKSKLLTISINSDDEDIDVFVRSGQKAKKTELDGFGMYKLKNSNMKITEALAAIPMTNVKRAKEFYRDILGLELDTLSDKLDMYWLKIGGNKFLLYKRNEKNKAEHTALSFTVDNINNAVDHLENKGVKFYESQGQKIFDLDGSLSAWFQDTEGNNLEISQRC